MAWSEKRGRSWRVRYYRDDGTIGSENGFATETAAKQRVKQIDADQSRGTFLDPVDGRISLAEWVACWQAGCEVGAGTWAKYRNHLDNHILVRFGDTPLTGINRIAVKAWAKDLHRHLAAATVADIVSLLSTLLNKAVEDRRIPANPCRGLRLMKRRPTGRRPVADPEQVLRIALRARHWQDAVLILTAAYTGMRWGELTGLRHQNVVLDGGMPRILIDPATGALHEIAGQLYLGPPKTEDSIRQVSLPPFLAEILRGLHDQAEQHPRELLSPHPTTGTCAGRTSTVGCGCRPSTAA